MGQFENVVKGLECCIMRDPDDELRCDICPYDGRCANRLKIDAIALINAQQERIVALEAGQKWISVKDRLPERSGEEYIVYITSNDGEKCVTCDHLVCSSRKHWFLFDGAEAVVTHWMPLPEPPKEDEHADE